MILIYGAVNIHILFYIFAQVFDLEGEYISTISHPDLRDPFGIACMRDGKFIVSDCKSRVSFNIRSPLLIQHAYDVEC